MKNLILFIAIIVFQVNGFTAHGEKTITGTVTDARDGSILPGVTVLTKNTANKTATDHNGHYTIRIPDRSSVLIFTYGGYETKEVKINNRTIINVILQPEISIVEEEVEVYDMTMISHTGRIKSGKSAKNHLMAMPSMAYESDWEIQNFNTEGYSTIHENEFLTTSNNPLSTFSIDVDAASYSNMRRFINNGQKPPKDAIRIEEMINYFNYNYPQPKNQAPFSINTELSACPWNDKHLLLHIGLQGREIATADLPASNLVFLIDVSGSMSSANKLPLLKSAFKMLVKKLRPNDHVSIVVYAGAAGLVLPPTPGSEKEIIIRALDRLNAGGSTAGGAGLKLAYKTAQTHFVEGGNNRIILATDGDFNIGASSNAEMERYIESERDKGIFMTVLGFGMGNYKDDKMEIIADKGNGNYAYIDNLQEARKVLVNEFGGTLFTIAKDVKMQVEFNPSHVKAYRLIGYENRKLKSEDFNNDKKDAGELGSGHTVTALYEIIPAGVESDFIHTVDDLKYQKNETNEATRASKELLTLKLRYKEPNGTKSKLITKVVKNKPVELQNTSDNYRWSVAVAGFGMLLRESPFKGDTSIKSVLQMAKHAKGEDQFGYRMEFIRLVESSEFLASRK